MEIISNHHRVPPLVVYKNETTDDVLIASFGTKSDKWAWIKAQKDQVVIQLSDNFQNIFSSYLYK
jgi:hypothetical protein